MAGRESRTEKDYWLVSQQPPTAPHLEAPVPLAAGALPDVLRHACDVGCVQRGVDLVKDEEGTGPVAVHREEESQGRHGLLATAELLHLPETLGRRHGGVLDAPVEGVIWALQGQVGHAAQGVHVRPRQLLVDGVDGPGDVVEGVREERQALLVHALELRRGLLRGGEGDRRVRDSRQAL